eukprot:scpid20383/ scgid10358/ Oxysterol-binding protein 1
MPDGKVSPDNYRGWLYKWTNYIRGYQKRWCVLNSGLLSYYRNEAEMAHTCRGTINLAGALIDTIDSLSFVVSNGGTQTFHLQASTEVERQRWVTALELAKAKAIKMAEAEQQASGSWEELTGQSASADNLLSSMAGKLEDLLACNELVTKHAHQLQRQLTDLDDKSLNTSPELKTSHEKAMLFKISSSAMLGACSDFVSLAQSQKLKWSHVLQQERSKRVQLEEQLETLAKQHASLEKAVKKRTNAFSMAARSDSTDGSARSLYGDDTASEGSIDTDSCVPRGGHSSDEDDEFFDAEDSVMSVSTPTPPAGQTGAAATAGVRGGLAAAGSNANWPVLPERNPSRARQRRKTIPTKPPHRMNLWSIMKNCIGRDLSKIPMPVNFNEPLSFLQKVCEVNMEYSNLLDKAASMEDTLEQLVYIAAHNISTCSTTVYRSGKPFNPMLGETYEWDRTEDLGWRCLCEQVSHHPPALAMDVQSNDWHMYLDYSASSKFRGKYLQIIPHTLSHVKFRRTGHHYTNKLVQSTVHNIIVGKLWVDQSGEVEIINHSTGERCHLKFFAYSYFSNQTPRKVTGVVYDRTKTARYMISGTWDSKVEYWKVSSSDPVGGQGIASRVPTVKSGPPITAWQMNPMPAGHDQRYGFSDFACLLNEQEPLVAPTDSRRRPDQRLMEEGNFEDANTIKLQLEDKQRERRRHREAQVAALEAQGKTTEAAQAARHKPRWFRAEQDPATGAVCHCYTGGYWESREKKEWSGLVDVFRHEHNVTDNASASNSSSLSRTA